jgi:hypothetical protein
VLILVGRFENFHDYTSHKKGVPELCRNSIEPVHSLPDNSVRLHTVSRESYRGIYRNSIMACG